MDKLKLTSNMIKKVILNKYRYERKHIYIATECGRFNADVLSCSLNNEFYEFEIKTSSVDMKRDFLKKKHKTYNNYPNKRGTSVICTPTYFYMVVPIDLVSDCKKLLTKYNNYGIISYNKKTNELNVIKLAKKLHTDNAEKWINKFKRIITMRMSSEICLLWNKHK